jgi:hypothetical protein
VTRLKDSNKATKPIPPEANFLNPLQISSQQHYNRFQLKMAEADTVLSKTSTESLPKIAEGKVRDLYEVDPNLLGRNISGVEQYTKSLSQPV